LPPVEPIIDFAHHKKAPAYFHGYSAKRPYGEKYGFAVALDACACGRFDYAEEVLSEAFVQLPLYAPPESVTEAFRYDLRYWNRAGYLLRILRTDRSQVIPLLHDWEAFTVKSCKMTRYWKPSPFPCEL
jgi:hypothetical protein